MTIAIASGKGGTGKTTLAVHLASRLGALASTVLADLDVEAPDALSYFPGASAGQSGAVTIQVAQAVDGSCDSCGRCASVCRFGAIVAIGGSVSVNPQLCKGCGRCMRACPTGSMRERPMVIGSVETAYAGALRIVSGKLAIGDIRSTSVIEETKRAASSGEPAYLVRDCPPGATCPTVRAVHGADLCLVVAEPTAFSLHDLRAALRFITELGIPVGVVLNKDGTGDADVEGLCAEFDAPLVARIPWTEELAKAGAAGRMAPRDPSIIGALDAIVAALPALAGGVCA